MRVCGWFYNRNCPTGATGAQGIQGIQGATGATGAQGATGFAATIDLAPSSRIPFDEQPHVYNDGTEYAAIFRFEIPAGEPGVTPHIDNDSGNWFIGSYDTGVRAQGEKGDDGVTPAFAIDEVQTLEPGEDATVDLQEDSQTSNNWLFSFGIPKGESGGIPADVEDFSLGTTVGSQHDIQIGNVIYRLQRISSSTLGMRLYLFSAIPDQDITIDCRRFNNYLTGVEGAGGFQGLVRDSYTLSSTPENFDDTIYMSSNEMHWLMLRQQDPVTLTWSLCEVRMFSSDDAQRVTVWINWINKDVTY